MQKSIIKGAIIFGVISFVVFISLLTIGFIMSAIGLSCNCFQIFKWSLIGVAIASGILFWFGCCCKPKVEDCSGIKGYKDQI